MNFDHAMGLLVGALLGAGIAAYLSRRRAAQLESARRMKLEVEAKEAELALRERQTEQELAFKRRETELDARSREIERTGEQTAAQADRLAVFEEQLDREQKALDEAEHEAKKMQRLYRLKLHQIAQMDQAAAKQYLIRSTEREVSQELDDLRRRKLGKTETEVNDEARRILLAAMQRITSQPMNDATATIVSLPSEEMKGRIIGREGRNIRTFEHATGATLMIDETPDSVLISCFDPVRREVARIALEALVRDGRIHPSSIEEEVQRAEQEMQAGVIDLGEGALRRLRLHDVHPEVVGLLGKLHYRLSNNQNTLAHSVEVANFCALIASEIGLDPVIAKRAGLFHDIGKAVDEAYSGSHAVVGADVIKQHGE
ncbi:MAG: Rnase Y domain-containing protein, partial [Verrucomicrobiota bacterium]